MMKKNLISLLVASLIGLPISGTAFAAVAQSGQKNPTNWVPFPWAQELPFTWSTAQGVWTVKTGSGAVNSYFYIRVTTDKFNKAIKFLSITEKEAGTCTTVATGFGTEENDKRIVAEMKYVNPSNARYRMMLRLYDPKAVPQGQDVQPFKGKVMVLTVMPKTSNKVYNYPMIKVSDRTEYPCKPVK
jgi:hypothetical protein